ncbi:unnamed protein product [Fraxinus pennsylvanica]|uniref:Uncharacterized protein n=1 Tax=Fraxinus pennsylvanica TaxID=56036 RepID=A0AAD1YMS9_9LAMI|nr:unnamed protein product [Fraxinus pennsylvanica]
MKRESKFLRSCARRQADAAPVRRHCGALVCNVPRGTVRQAVDRTKQLNEELNMVEDIDGEGCQMQSWQFIDDEISNCVNNSTNSSSCTSQTYDNPEDIVLVSNGKKETHNEIHEAQKTNQQKLNSSDSRCDDIHYQSVLSNLLKSSQHLLQQ